MKRLASEIDSQTIVASRIPMKRLVIVRGTAERPTNLSTPQALVVLKRPAMKRPASQIEMHCQEEMHRGHYDVLGVHRYATANEIRSAFKAGALQKHPDKGGAVADWNRFWTAWEALKDEASRATYNTELNRSGCQDGIIAGIKREQAERPLPQHSRLKLGQARRLLEEYLLGICTDESLEAALRQWELNCCLALLELTRGSRANMDVMPDETCTRRVANVQGISKRANGAYRIYVSWRSFEVEALETRSLAKALDYHLALDCLKQKLMSRTSGEFILAEELLSMLLVHPHLELRFHYRKNRFRTPRFVDVQLADLYAQRLCRATTEKAARGIIQKARAEGERNRRSRDGRLFRLKDVLTEELARRAKASELNVNMLQDVLARRTKADEIKFKALEDTLQQRGDHFASTLRSQVMPVMQVVRPPLLNGPLTRELWPVSESNCCCRIVEFLSFRELRAFQEASYATKCSRDLGVVWVFSNFQYVPGDARIGLVPPRSRNGRDKWHGGARGITAQRIFLEGFLPRQKALLGQHEQTSLNFARVRGELLEGHAVQEFFSGLSGLKQIILPSQGWTYPVQKRHVLKAFKPTVNVVFNFDSGRMRRRQASATTCPKGHDLQRHVNIDGDENACDCCGRDIQLPEFFFRCNDCDFDHCQACYEA